jgi:regulator of RNase E activity RraA
VVFQDLDDPPAAAVFGEVMCTTYKAFGAIGLVTNGAGRDLDQVEALDFPVFTGGTICAHGYCHIPSINVPVRVGGVVICPGDVLHADRNGVTTIPDAIVSGVARACAEYVAAEAVVLDYLKSGRIDPKGYAAARGECHQRIEALGRKLRSL